MMVSRILFDKKLGKAKTKCLKMRHVRHRLMPAAPLRCVLQLAWQLAAARLTATHNSELHSGDESIHQT